MQPANAGVHVGVGIGIGGPGYYGYGPYPTALIRTLMAIRTTTAAIRRSASGWSGLLSVVPAATGAVVTIAAAVTTAAVAITVAAGITMVVAAGITMVVAAAITAAAIAKPVSRGPSRMRDGPVLCPRPAVGILGDLHVVDEPRLADEDCGAEPVPGELDVVDLQPRDFSQ